MARKNRDSSTLVYGDIVLDLINKEVTVRGTTHRLNTKECKLLATFMVHPGQTLTQEFIMQEVWETDFIEDTRTIQVHVSWLRKKIEEDPANPCYIQTVRGVGYVFGRS